MTRNLTALIVAAFLAAACNHEQQTGTLALKAASSTFVADTSTVELTITAKAPSGAPGAGTCHVEADRGSLNGGSTSLDLPLTGGTATFSYACDARADPACAGGHTLRARWNGVAAVAAACGKLTCGILGKSCDTISDHCGGNEDCGSCAFPQICGIRADAGVCADPEFDRVCTPEGVCWEHPLPLMRFFTAVAGTGPSDVWAGLNTGLTLHWNGVTWSAVKTPKYQIIRAMQFDAPNHGMAITWDSTVLGWDGNSWTERTPPSPDAGLNAAWFAPDGGAWAVSCGYDGTSVCASASCPFDVAPRLMHWDGATWTDYAMPFSGERELDYLWGLSADDLYATGSQCFPTLAHWDGQRWTQLTTQQNTPIEVGGLWEVSPDSIWGASNTGIEHWNGAAWTVEVPNKNYSLTWASSDFDVWAFAGDSDDDPTAKYPINHALHWDGGTWTPVSTGLRGFPRMMWGSSAEAWAFGDQGSISRVSGGALSPISYAAITAGRLDAVCSFKGGDAVAVGTTGEYMAVGDAEVLRRASNGVWAAVDSSLWETQVDVTGLAGALHGVACLAPDTIVAVGEGGTVLTFRGGRWTLDRPAGGNVHYQDVWGTSFDDLWAVGIDDVQGQIAAHHDASGWHTVAVPSTSAVHGSATNDVWSVGWAGHIAHWDGASWQAVASPTTANLHDVFALSSIDAWAVGDDATVIHWDGNSWQTVANPGVHDDGFFTVVARSPTDVWVAGISLMHWNGTAWSIIDRQTVSWLYNGSTTDGEGRVWFVGWADAVLVVQ